MVEKNDLIWIGVGAVIAYYATKKFPDIVPKNLNTPISLRRHKSPDEISMVREV